MYRGQVARVRFAVVQGVDQSVADGAARSGAAGDITDAVGRVRYARRMEARLTGQGFEITAITPARLDTGGSGEAAWEWRIRPTRSNAHYLQVEAWTLKPDNSRGPPIRYPTYAVAVPVRWWPDRMQDLTADSIGWFGQGTSWLKALAALLAAAAAAWAAWKKLRPPKPQASSTVAP